MNIEKLELSIRSSGALTRAGITTVEQLVALSWGQLSAIKDAGEKSLTEICWACVQVLNGRFLKQALEFDAQFPSRIHRKNAEKYERIARIVLEDFKS